MKLKLLRQPFAVLVISVAFFGASTTGTQAASPNLIINGGFETGDFTGWATFPSSPAQTFFGVSNAAGTIFTVVPPGTGSNGPILVHSGTYAAFFGGTGPQFDAITQSVPTISRPLLKGVYQVSFFLAPNPSVLRGSFPIPSAFQALWNGNSLYSTVNTPSGVYQGYTFTVKATGSSSALTFQGFSQFNSYNLDDVSVTLVGLEQGSFTQYARTPNGHSTAVGLDHAGFNPATSPLLQYLDYRDLKQLPGDFDRIAPEELASIYTMGVALEQVQAGNIQRRGDDIRAGVSGFSAAGLAINGTGPSFSGGLAFNTGVAGPSGDDGKESKEMKQVAPADNRWGAFLSGTGEWISVGNTDNARGYDLASGGFTLGVDYKVTPNLAIGLAGGYTGTTADLTQGGRVYVNGGKIGLYGTFFQNEQPAATMSKDSSKDSSKEAPTPEPSIAKGFYADVAVFGGYNSYDTHRSALLGTARGDTDGGELDALFGVGYDFKTGGLTFGPTASFNYTYVGTNSFTETGSLAPLNIHGDDAESLRSAFGFKASYDWKVAGIIIKPEVRAAWQHEYGQTAYAVDSSFANGGGGTFTVNGPDMGRDSALLGAGFAIQCSERCSTYFYYDGELGRKNYQSTSVTGGIRLAF